MNATARNIAEGYRRGWGLQFGDIEKEIDQNPLFQKAADASWSRSYLDKAKKMNLFLLLTEYIGNLQCQNVIEFGAYRGGTSIFMAVILKELYPKARVFALDTYEGLIAADEEKDLTRPGSFSDTSAEDVQAAIEEAELDNIVVVKGLFAATYPLLREQGHCFGLAHIDCDVYDSVKYAQAAVRPQMAPGGYLVFDGALVSSCIGAMQAVEEMVMQRRVHSEQVYPHLVFRA